MTDADLARRRRATAALGLGVLWVARRSGGDDADADRSDGMRAATIAALDHDALEAAVTVCKACRLSRTRTHAVFGTGFARPRLLLVGTAPDAGDDVSGVAYSDAPGRLLDAMLGSIGFARSTDVFVTHRVKCRPPDDRAPTPEEVASCAPFLERQTALMAPVVVVALGREAAAEGRIVVPDPKALIAAPEEKAHAWAALCEVRGRSSSA